jgi:Trypsin-like serine proteases, typically periplasmic, contain C-terminal PDZ domain
MILDSEGYILTNNHVAGGATKINVLLNNGKTYPAKLIGADPKTDIAVIKIEAKESLPTVTFGDSDKVQVGEWVVAIGHPRGLDQTVTQGIISAKHRTGVTDPSTYQDFLQTDAAINPGNSGGPLLNLEGQVIGVNAAIMSQSGGFEGLGFAIPSNMALHVANALIAHGKVERGWLGVSVQDFTPDLTKSFKLEAPQGALIGNVVKGGPADMAGIKTGDVVLSFRGKEVSDSSTLRNEVANTPIGDEVKVTIWRDGKRQEFKVKIGNLEDATKNLMGYLKDRLGAEFQTVTPKEAEKYNLSSPKGVVITWLDPKGALAEAGFEEGDLILGMNGQDIADKDGLADLMSQVPPNQKITLLGLDHNSGNTGFVQVVVR